MKQLKNLIDKFIFKNLKKKNELNKNSTNIQYLMLKG